MAALAPPSASNTYDNARQSAAPARPDVSASPGLESSWRSRTRQRPLLGPVWQAAVFLAGLLCISAGVVLAVLPGPLTIPPVLLGLYVWSTEFGWARRVFGVVRIKARQAWQHARQHPRGDGALTIGGLVLAAVAMWTVGHFHLVAWAGDLFAS